MDGKCILQELLILLNHEVHLSLRDQDTYAKIGN